VSKILKRSVREMRKFLGTKTMKGVRKMRVTWKAIFIVLLVFSVMLDIVFVTFAKEMTPPYQYATLTEYQKTTGKEISKFNEAPQLAELVKQGKLPPVEKRLPKEPLVIVPLERIGEYGGTWRSTLLGRADASAIWRIVAYEPLIRWSPDFSKILPNIAERWTVTNGGKVFTFYLRQGIKWSDGEPFTADDIMFWYEDIILNKDLTPVVPRWLTSDGKEVEVEKVGNYVIRFKFTQPQGLFLQYLANSPWCFAPKHYMKQFHPRYVVKEKLDAMIKDAKLDHWYQLFSNMNDSWMNPNRPTINAWKLVTPLGVGTRVVLERNPYYWKIDIVGNQLPYIDKLTFDIVENQETLTLKALNGEIDMQYRFVGGGIKGYPLLMENREKGQYRVIKAYPVSMNEILIFFNLNHKDPVLRKIFNDRRFRIAMSHAINRKEIIDLCYLGQAQPYQAAPLPQSPYYYEKYAKAYIEYDPNKANQLLDEIGLIKRDGEGFRLRPDGKTLAITLEIASLPNPWPDAAELIRKYWQQVGVKVDIKLEDRSLWTIRTSGAEHDVSIWFGDGGVHTALIESWWYLPISNYSRQAPLWGIWYATRGKSGEEPPLEVKKQMQLYDQILVTTDSKKQKDLFRQILDIDAQNLYVIGVCTRPFAPGVVKNNFFNVPDEILEDSVAAPGQTNPCQYFIKQ
jgi:peptide/nickel transport system substrate-binding protein